MVMQAKLNFDIKSEGALEFYNPPIAKIIDCSTYKNRNLGDSFIQFIEYNKVIVTFLSDDPNAFIEIEACDKEESIILRPNESETISEGGDSEGMLVPDYYSIKVLLDGESYKGTYRVSPSIISESGLYNLRKSLEEIIGGLSYNLYIKRYGELGDKVNDVLSPSQLYNYIKANKNMLLNNIDFIIRNPITDLVKVFKESNVSKRPDQKSQKWLATKGASLNKNLYIPDIVYEKHTEINIINNENKWVKKIIREINELLCMLEDNYEKTMEYLITTDNQLNIEYGKEVRTYQGYLASFIVTSKEKRKLSGRLKNIESEQKKIKERLFYIGDICEDIKKLRALLLHYEYDTWLSRLDGCEKITKPTLILMRNPRYAQLYNFYMEIREMMKQTDERGKVVFQHKKTSKVFEYFTLAMLINIFDECGLTWEKGWLAGSGENIEKYNGEIPAGTELIFGNEKFYCSMIYDKEVRKFSEVEPGYLAVNNLNNNKPDITVVITDRVTGSLIGIFIIEVKCRISRYIYSNIADTKPMEQIRDYINLSYKDKNIKREQRGKVDKVLLVYPKQQHPIINREDNGFIYIQAEAEANIKNSIGYEEIKAEIEQYFIEEDAEE